MTAAAGETFATVEAIFEKRGCALGATSFLDGVIAALGWSAVKFIRPPVDGLSLDTLSSLGGIGPPLARLIEQEYSSPFVGLMVGQSELAVSGLGGGVTLALENALVVSDGSALRMRFRTSSLPTRIATIITGLTQPSNEPLSACCGVPLAETHEPDPECLEEFGERFAPDVVNVLCAGRQILDCR